MTDAALCAIDYGRQRFMADIRAAVVVDDAAAAAIERFMRMAMSHARAIERDRCARIARRLWYRGGRAVAARLIGSNEI